MQATWYVVIAATATLLVTTALAWWRLKPPAFVGTVGAAAVVVFALSMFVDALIKEAEAKRTQR